MVIRGGGEMGSGVAWRLRRCGFDVIIAEIPQPTAVRRWVAFSEAVYERTWEVEGQRARLTPPSEIGSVIRTGEIPVVLAQAMDDIRRCSPDVVVDAILAKHNTGTTIDLAPRVVALGPGFTAGVDAHCVIETNRGPGLGRCLWEGTAEANTGTPGLLGGESARRILRSPVAGPVEPLHAIGELVKAGEVVATVHGLEIRSRIDGILRGMIRAGTCIEANGKIGDVDPRRDVALCRRISDKALAIAGGVLEGILTDRLT